MCSRAPHSCRYNLRVFRHLDRGREGIATASVIISVIPKSVHPDRIQANIRIFDFALSDNEMERLASLDTGKALIGNPGSPEKVETAMTW